MALKIPEFDQVVLPKVGANEQLQSVTHCREQMHRDYETYILGLGGMSLRFVLMNFRRFPYRLLDT